MSLFLVNCGQRLKLALSIFHKKESFIVLFDCGSNYIESVIKESMQEDCAEVNKYTRLVTKCNLWH